MHTGGFVSGHPGCGAGLARCQSQRKGAPLATPAA